MGEEKEMKESTLLGSEFESSLRVLLLLDELEHKSLDEIQILVLDGFITFTANKKGYSYSINAKGHEIANDLSDPYSREYRIAVREVSTVFPSLNASAMQKQIYKITMNSLEAYNE